MASAEPRVGATREAFAIPEILARILSHTVHTPNGSSDRQSVWGDDRMPGMTTAEPPWIFLLVCKHWHQVVLSTPALWSTFVVILKDCCDADVVHLSSMLDAHLERSKSAPLTLVIFLSFYSSARPVYYDLMQKLMLTQHRWQDVTLDIRAKNDPQNSFDHPPMSMDLAIRLREMKALVKLSVNFAVETRSRDSHLVKIELGPCPRLEHMELGLGTSTLVREGDDAEIYFPILRSVSVHLGRRKADNGWQALLQHSPSIEHLEIRSMIEYFGAMRPTFPSIDLPNLRSMVINSDNIACVLQCFNLPPLFKLKVTYHVGVNDITDERLTEFAVALKNFTVEDLSFDSSSNEVPSGEEAFQDFLRSQACVGLRRLFFSNVHEGAFSPALASALTTALQPPFLPHLDTLGMEMWLSDITEMTDISSVRDLILACRKRYSAFHFVLSFRALDLDDPSLTARIEDEFYSDYGIQSCVTASFRIHINGAELEGPFEFGQWILRACCVAQVLVPLALAFVSVIENLNDGMLSWTSLLRIGCNLGACLLGCFVVSVSLVFLFNVPW